MISVKDDADIELLTITEVAQRQRVSPRTVRRQIENGDLPYYRLGRAIRVSVEDLRGFLKRARR
jgi:excisionase family DNA binding protein